MLVATGGQDAMLLTLLVLGPVMALYGVWTLVGDLRKSSKHKLAERLKGRSSEDATQAAFDSLRKSGPKTAGLLGDYLSKLRQTATLQTMIDQANLKWSAATMLSNQSLIAGAAIVICLVFKLPVLIGIGVALAVFILPVLYLIQRRRTRLRKLVNQLPDVFELLSQALSAGHSLASGMQVIANELPDPAGTEFGRVFHEQNLGLKIEDALKNFAERNDILDVRFFVTAVLIQRQTGGDLSEILDKISDVIRDRIKLQGTVMALTAEGRLSGYVLLALPVLVFIAMLKINFDYASMLWTHPTGQMMATSAVVMMLMGWAMIKKIVNIKI